MNIQENIKAFLEKETQQKIEDSSVNLIERGVLDSFTMIKLIGFIESSLGIVPRMEALTPENFNSLETIANIVESWIPHITKSQ